MYEYDDQLIMLCYYNKSAFEIESVTVLNRVTNSYLIYNKYLFYGVIGLILIYNVLYVNRVAILYFSWTRTIVM
jgi:hypothetical protein